ncbi:MAG: hypothetical protein EOM73_05825, partial [Bacteroidia bacterium]|nr:hypothetical protein [Bacteroidia bacterium]
MGFRIVTIKMPTGYSEPQLRHTIGRQLRIRNFSFQVENKSLDARKKPNVFWELRVAVSSSEIKDGEPSPVETLEIPYKKRKQPVVVAGSGPAGFFAAFVLQKAGFPVTLLERGSEVAQRSRSVSAFERTGIFDRLNNYAFGEGGAGTFSDGKLTSRSKHISKEKQFILSSYIKAGAPEEIGYLTHPHLGTDNLRKIVKNLRLQFEDLGGQVLFETMLEDITVKNSRVTEVVTPRGTLPAGALFVAPGHSAYETYRMLIRRGVPFRTKNFAIGCRMEHPQEIINRAQWGRENLPGVKAAEYRLTSPADGVHPVYSFCMCPGGTVVPAAAYPETNIVNGMSFYQRNGRFANAACVAGIHPDELAGKPVSPLDALEAVSPERPPLSGSSPGRGVQLVAETAALCTSGKAVVLLVSDGEVNVEELEQEEALWQQRDLPCLFVLTGAPGEQKAIPDPTGWLAARVPSGKALSIADDQEMLRLLGLSASPFEVITEQFEAGDAAVLSEKIQRLIGENSGQSGVDAKSGGNRPLFLLLLAAACALLSIFSSGYGLPKMNILLLVAVLGGMPLPAGADPALELCREAVQKTDHPDELRRAIGLYQQALR